MKRFFDRVVNRTTPANQSESNISKPNKIAVPNEKNNLKKLNSSNLSDTNAIQLIKLAARAFTSAIDDILHDANSLSNNNDSGFLKLIYLIENTDYEVDFNHVTAEGSLDILLQNKYHAKFLEVCNEYGVANSLFNAIRLLRMYEIKIIKENSDFNGNDTSSTLNSMERIMNIFQVLCSSSQTVEILRPSLVKLFTFPLLIPPPRTLDFQKMMANLISIICKNGFNSQIVWYLHDQQAMNYIVKSFTDMTTISESKSSEAVDEQSLKGLNGEKYGLWITGLQVIIEILNASLSVSSVLLADFERAGGYSRIVYVVENSSIDNTYLYMSEISKLLYNPQKGSDGSATSLDCGIILSDILISCLRMKRRITNADDINKLKMISQSLYESGAKSLRDENIIQNISYVLLTIYSDNSKNCQLLESKYNLLPTLLVSLCSIELDATASAILTTLNYVCHCVENASNLSLIALCSSLSLILDILFSDVSRKDVLLTTFDAIISTLDTLLRASKLLTKQLVNIGMLTLVFEYFFSVVLSSIQIDPISNYYGCILNKILSLLSLMVTKDNQIIDNIQDTRISDLLFSILKSPNFIQGCSIDKLLSVLSTFAIANNDSLCQYLKLFTEFIYSILAENNIILNIKLPRILHSLTNIFQLAKRNAVITWLQLGGLDTIIDVFKKMENTFSKANDISDEKRFMLLNTLVDLIHNQIYFWSLHPHDISYDDNLFQIVKYIDRLSPLLFQIGLFDSMFDTSLHLSCNIFINLIMKKEEDTSLMNVANPICILFIFNLLDRLSDNTLNYLIQELVRNISLDFFGIMRISEANIMGFLFPMLFYRMMKVENQTKDLIFKFISSIVLSSNMTSLIHYFKYFIRPSMLMSLSQLRLLSCAKSYASQLVDDDFIERDMNPFQYLNCFLEDPRSSLVTLDSKSLTSVYFGQYNNKKFNNIQLAFKEISFPTRRFSFSAWFRITKSFVIGSDGDCKITIFTLFESNCNGKQQVLSIQIDCRTFDVFVYFKQNEVIQFQSSSLPIYDSWIHLLFTFRSKSINSSMCVYIQGKLLEITGTSKVDNPSVECDISLMNLNESKLEVEIGETTSQSNLLWEVGLVNIFDYLLSTQQLGIILCNGPSYRGSYQGKAMNYSSSVVATITLRESIARTNGIKVIEHLDSLGLSIYETINDPVFEPTIERVTLAKPLLNFIPQHMTSIINSMIDYERPKTLGEIKDRNQILSSESFSSYIYHLGGPVVLLPILQIASSPQAICSALRLFQSSLSSSYNLKYMKKVGYKLISLILSFKPRKVITLDVLQVIFEFAISKTSASASFKKSSENLLLVDSSALFYLVLNHQVWNCYSYSIVLFVFETFLNLVQDIRYGMKNAKKLSSLGLTSWVLHFCILGAETSSEVLKTSSNTVNDANTNININTNTINDNTSNTWRMLQFEDFIFSDNNDEKDPFLKLSMNITVCLMATEIHLRDLEILSSFIAFSLQVSSDPTIVHSMFSPDNIVSISAPSLERKKLDCYSLVRVYFLRLLFQIFESCDLDSKLMTSTSRMDFLKVFHINWLFHIMTSAQDLSSKSSCLRLIILLFQSDPLFHKDFIKIKGVDKIESCLMSSFSLFHSKIIGMVLPLIAMTFRIPVQMIPFPSQVITSSKILQITELEECLGPDSSIPGEGVLTIRMLSILIRFVSISNIHRIKDEDRSTFLLIHDIIMGLIFHYYEVDQAFRKLFQDRQIIESIAICLLSSSDALFDYGSKLYSTNSIDFDLKSTPSMAIHFVDDYLDANNMNIPSISSDDVAIGDKTLDNTEDTFNLTNNKYLEIREEGLRCLSVIVSLINSSVHEFSNPMILSQFCLFYPSNLKMEYVYSYQLIIIQQFYHIMNNIFQSKSPTTINPKILLNVSQILLNLVPLIKAGVLELAGINQAILCIYYLIDKDNELSQKISRDVISSGRYFVATLMFKMIESKSWNDEVSLPFLIDLSRNIHKLFINQIDDNIDMLSLLRTNRSTNGSQSSDIRRVDAIATLESFQVFNQLPLNDYLTVKKNHESSVLSNIEKMNVSNYFIVIILIECIKLALIDVSDEIYLIAMRITSRISIHRRVAMLTLFGSSNIDDKSLAKLKEFHNLYEAILNLLPKGDVTNYDNAIVENNFSNDVLIAEKQRFQCFREWIASNNELVVMFLSYLGGSLTSLISVDVSVNRYSTIKQLQDCRLQDNKTISIEGESLRRNRAFSNAKLDYQMKEFMANQIPLVCYSLKYFKLRGLAAFGFGLLHWKQSHCMLQHSSIWGYSVDMTNESNYWTTTSDLGVSDAISGYRLCRLDPSEGRERMRRVLDQDYFDYGKALHRSSSNKFEIETELTVSIQANDNMESFVKELTKQGMIKKVEDSSTIITQDEMSPVDATTTTSLLSLDQETDNTLFDSSINMNEEEMLLQDDSNVIEYLSDGIAIDTPTKNDFTGKTETIASRNEGATTLSSKLEVSSTFPSKSSIIEEVLKGLVGANEFAAGTMYNIEVISGLETSLGLLIMTSRAVHFIHGIALELDGQDINQPEPEKELMIERMRIGRNVVKTMSTTSVFSDDNQEASKVTNRRFVWLQDKASTSTSQTNETINELILNIGKAYLDTRESSYTKIMLHEVYAVFKHRHQLKYTSIEVTDYKGISVLFSLQSASICNQVLLRLFQSEHLPLLFRPLSASRSFSTLGGVNSAYKTLISQFLSHVMRLWQHGEITNFEYLMHLNAASGRSFQDLTQYPVFPWIISDYSSMKLDLNDPTVYRDLSKPMGALGTNRAIQFRERFSTMDEFYKEGIDNSPPYHYGTHYSCAGYVLYYLIRLQPYTSYAIALQGGQFDIADRLFLNIEHSWKSASSENLQDVRELIPEFFYLPEFLVNCNKYDFGVTQKHERVCDIVLPAWAHNDPREFIRINRAALESRYVSEHLHEWIDLIFGCKQKGRLAEEAQNLFIHITYEGEVDIDQITDPIMQKATISQINNFGQTPSMLFSKPHPKRNVPELFHRVLDNIVIDPAAASWFSHSTPPFSVIGAPQVISVIALSYNQVLTVTGIIGDIQFTASKCIALNDGNVFLPPHGKRYIRYGNLNGSIAFCLSNPRDSENNDLQVIEELHTSDITSIRVSQQGDCFITGSSDYTVRLWRLVLRNNSFSIEPLHFYVGHAGRITCLDINLDYNMIASGSTDRTVCIWDTRTGRLRVLISNYDSSLVSVSINKCNGNIVTMTEKKIRIFSINGYLLCEEELPSRGTCAIANPCPEWIDGIVAITGHEGGQLILWKMHSIFIEGTNKESVSTTDKSITCISLQRKLIITHIPPRVHKSPITCLRLIPISKALTKIKDFVTDKNTSSDENNYLYDLFAGDMDGYVSRWTTQRLDQLSQQDLQSIF